MSIEELQQIFDLKSAYCGILSCLIIMCVLLFAITVLILFFIDKYFEE